MLRKLLSILLLAVFGLPLVSPLFALTATSGGALPACCRRGGQHHCAMSPAERGQFAGKRPEFRNPTEKCPYSTASMAVSQHTYIGFLPAEAIFAGLVSHPTVAAQTESKWRIARDRTRSKRGPPSHFLL
jgi:hypothetical protein